MKKSSNTAAILNFLLPGTGYIYAEKRIVFGWIILIAMLLTLINNYNNISENLLALASALILSIGFAYDIHQELQSEKVLKRL